MSRRTRRGCAQNARPNLSVEHLESRNLMAANTMSAATPLLEPVDDATQPTLTPATVDNARLRTLKRPPAPTPATPTRSYDGTGNNLANPEWGSTNEQLLRVAENDYADGISTPGGEDRPSARAVSNAIVAHGEEETTNDRQLSAFIYIWGQFLDHDIDLTEPPTTGKEAFNVAVPKGDQYFDPDNSGGDVIALSRSRYDATTGKSTDNPREQINQITAWIDGSMVYGSDKATADSLRTFVGGKLRNSAANLPPTDAAGNFVAGDVRSNENIELSSMHALFIREHNWWAAKIARENPNLTDEQIYQKARAIVGAELQVITYKEFLPALLGNGALTRYAGYNPTVDPSIANEFSTAAFRLGHSLINDDVEFFDNEGRAVEDEVALRDAFNNPNLLRETGIDTILKYAASTNAEELDNQIVDSLRNFLFGQPGQGGFDLASLNIQRGRDHGLADYNSVREAYGLARADSFDDISSDPNVQATLKSLYGTVDNIDLWVGGLAEDHVAGASVGPTIRAIVADQFERLRDGDRFWYQRAFSGTHLSQLEQTTLASVIKRNTTTQNLQGNVFFMKAELIGQVYLDSNASGGVDRREIGIPGITVELLDDEGEVIAATITDRSGRYRFTQFRETGDYQVRIVLPSRLTATSPTTMDVWISRGGMSITGYNFGLKLGRPNANAVDSALALNNNWQMLA